MRPRLRRRGAGEGGEVEVPAYAAMPGTAAVASRSFGGGEHAEVGSVMADTVGVEQVGGEPETVPRSAC